MDIANIWQYNLRKGSTDHPSNGACLFNAGMWLAYGKIGDNHPCSCPIIRRYAIGLNDRFDDAERQLLKPFILRVVGNRDPSAESDRLRFIVLETARRILPLAFERRQPALAAALRGIPNDISFGDLWDQLRGTQASAFAYAAYAAAADAAYAAADATAAAAYAADAAACKQVTTEGIWILDNVLRIGNQSPEFDEEAVRQSVREFEAVRAMVLA